MLSYFENKKRKEVSSLNIQKVVKTQEWGSRITKVFARLFLRPKIYGLENLEALLKLRERENQGILIVSNHTNAFDPFFIFASVPREIRQKIFPIIFLGKKELFSSDLKKSIVEHLGAIPVGNGSGRNVRTVLRKLKDGAVIFLFPEGTVSRDGNLGKDLGAVNFFSHCASFILQPVRISGIRGWKQDWLNILLFRRRLEIRFGKPMLVSKGDQLEVMDIIQDI